ncbi:MAG TPA: hypothetical protein VLA36_00965 [Longimicrobiales bacterium]|nr:hypothetical protein [Longimicrobiales bacterium]
MSPSSRGLVPGLFLALVAALGVLTANNHWLFPAQGETGARYVLSAPALARGEIPITPWIPSGHTTPQNALAGRAPLMPALMAGLIHQGVRPHVSALWILAGSAALVVLGVSWVTGGVAGMAGALATALILMVAPLSLETVTVLGPDALLAATSAFLLGAMTYRPKASAIHGALGAMAWLAHPAGLGLLAVSIVWPFSRRDAAGARRFLLAGTAVLPALLLMAAGLRHPLLRLPVLPGGATSSAGGALSGAMAFLGAGLPGAAGVVLGGGLGLLLIGLVVAEARATPPPPSPVHWSDPAARDALALAFRPAAALVALGALLGAWAAGTPEDPSAPWFAATVPAAALAGTAVVRWTRRQTSGHRWVPLAILTVWLAASAMGSRHTLRDLRETGRGYTSAHWVDSPVIRWIDNRSGPYAILYADQPALVFLQTGRPSRELDLGSRGLEAFVSDFEEEPGALVLTGGALPVADTLASRLDLRVLAEDPRGRALGR